MEAPEPGDAPEILPVMAPIVQLKLHGTLAVKGIFSPEPLQVVSTGELVIEGLGYTVTTIE